MQFLIQAELLGLELSGWGGRRWGHGRWDQSLNRPLSSAV